MTAQPAPLPEKVPRRHIYLFIDGTWKEDSTDGSTNVKKLFDATQEGVDQLDGTAVEHRKFYIPGVGKIPSLVGGSNGAKLQGIQDLYLRPEFSESLVGLLRRIAGGAFGRGTAARVKAAYHLICDNYREKEGDRLFMFGFSRGAFAVRSLVGFIDHVGLLLADKLEYVETAYLMYEFGEKGDQSELEEFLRHLTGVAKVLPEGPAYVKTHFLGVWDTVGALGLPLRLSEFSAPYTEYHQVAQPPSIITARHALAVHELRKIFEPLLFTIDPKSATKIKQVWFAGAHADVGGGYVAGEDGLSDITLRWMAREASDHGLGLKQNVTWRGAQDECSPVHHQIREWFAAADPTMRSWLDLEVPFDESHFFHRSVIDYLTNAASRNYQFNFPLVNASLQHVDTATIRRAVQLTLAGQEIVENES